MAAAFARKSKAGVPLSRHLLLPPRTLRPVGRVHDGGEANHAIMTHRLRQARRDTAMSKKDRQLARYDKWFAIKFFKNETFRG